MTIAHICILIACLLPIVTVGMAKAALARKPRAEGGGYDNAHPRDWESKFTGWHARANAAQMNGFEALPLFIAGVILAQVGGANPSTVDTLAMAFVGLRVAYTWAYLSNHASLRSLIWFGGMAVSVALLALG